MSGIFRGSGSGGGGGVPSATGVIPGSSLIVAFDDEIKWFDPDQHIILYDDFVAGIVYSSLGWKGNNNGGTIRTNQTADSGNPGFFSVQTGTSSTSTPSLTLFEFNAWGGIIFGAGRARGNFVSRLRNLSDGSETYVARIGFADQQSAAPNNGLWFEYTHSVNSGNWTIKSANGGSTTTANTSTAADTDWNLFSIEVNADATSVSFSINGTEVANSPVTTNIPTNACGPFFSMTKSVGTTTRDLDADQFFFFQELTTARNA